LESYNQLVPGMREILDTQMQMVVPAKKLETSMQNVNSQALLVGNSISGTIGASMDAFIDQAITAQNIIAQIVKDLIKAVAKQLVFKFVTTALGIPTVPGLAHGGSFPVGGRGGTDNNVLSINGVPRAKVSASETVSVTPNGGGITIQNVTVQANNVNELITEINRVASSGSRRVIANSVIPRGGRA